jgi:ATP-binding cassette, subfamily B, bacterial
LKLPRPIEELRQRWSVFPKSIVLLWRAAPLETTLLNVLLSIQGLAPALSLWLSKTIIDAVVGLTEGVSLWQLVGLWGLVLSLGPLFMPWVALLQGNLTEKLGAKVNLALIHKSNSIPDLHVFENETFYNDLEILRNQASYRPLNMVITLLNAVRNSITCLSLLFLLFSFSWWLPVLILIASLPHGIVERKLNELSWAVMEKNGPESRRMNYATSLSLNHQYAKETRLFNLSHFLERYYLSAFNILHTAMRQHRQRQALWPLPLIALGLLGQVAAFAWIVFRASAGAVSAGSIVLYLQALITLQEMLMAIIYNFTWLHGHLLFFEKLFNFLDFKSAMPVKETAVKPPTTLQQGIHFQDVSFAYPDGRKALEHITVTLHPGERVAIVGENGAGKTTFIKLLTRLYDPTEGKIEIDGTDLRDLDLGAWRSQVSATFQDFGHYHLTVAENIHFGETTDKNTSSKLALAADQSDFVSVVDSLPQGYETQLGKQFGGTELSGGQWQKLALARAFFKDGQVLVLDEPTAALDPKAEYEVYKHFLELSKGKLTLLITHRLASVHMADRILVFDKGRLAEEGTHASLMQLRGIYYHLFTLQASAYQKKDEAEVAALV